MGKGDEVRGEHQDDESKDNRRGAVKLRDKAQSRGVDELQKAKEKQIGSNDSGPSTGKTEKRSEAGKPPKTATAGKDLQEGFVTEMSHNSSGTRANVNRNLTVTTTTTKTANSNTPLPSRGDIAIHNSLNNGSRMRDNSTERPSSAWKTSEAGMPKSPDRSNPHLLHPKNGSDNSHTQTTHFPLAAPTPPNEDMLSNSESEPESFGHGSRTDTEETDED